MPAPITFKWLANFSVSDFSNFKDRFYTDYDNEKIQAYKELQRQKSIVQMMNQLITIVDNKLLQLLSLYFYAVNSDNTFIQDYWKSILTSDLKIKESCMNEIMQILFTDYWTQDTVNKVAKKLKNCIQQSTDRTKLMLFPTLLDKHISPTDFPFENFKDYLSSWISFASYTVNAAYVPIIAYLHDTYSYDYNVDNDWNSLVKQLIKQKLRDNLFNEDQLKKYLYVNYIPIVRQQSLNWYFEIVNNIKVLKAVTYAVYQALHDFSIELIKTKDLHKFIESYNFEAKLQHYFDSIKNLIVYKLNKFDKNRINNYMSDVSNKSDHMDHIHPALYPIWQFLCESVDLTSEDSWCLLYNALDSIHYCSHFDAVDVKDYTLSSEPDVYTFEKLGELAQYIKQMLLAYQPNVSEYQMSDWFYETYLSVASIITSSLNDAYNVLLAPLYDELVTHYNVVDIEDLKSNLNSRVFMRLKMYQDSNFNRLVSIMHNIRSQHDFSKAIDDFETTTCKTLTKQLKQILNEFLEHYRDFLPLNPIKGEIKQIIIDEVSKYASDSQLLFDTLSQNLGYLVKYDTYYGNFENAFINKLRYDLEKFKQQMEHTLIGSIYMNIFKFDTISYTTFVDTYYKDHIVMLKKLEYILFAVTYADRLRYESTDVTEFTVYLKAPYDVIKKLESRKIPLNLVQQIMGS